MSSGTREPWHHASLPQDSAAADRVAEWRAQPNTTLRVIGLDLRGVDFSAADLTEAWFTQANLQRARFVGSDLYRANLENADLTEAVLTRASLVRAELDEARLVSANLDGADLTSASVYGVNASSASFRGADLTSTSLTESDLRDASLAGARCKDTMLKITANEHTDFRGLTGSVFGPIRYVTAARQDALGGDDLQEFLRSRGAEVTVLRPRRETRSNE